MNEGKWQTYKEAFEVSENDTIIRARLWNGVNEGKYIEEKVTKIDKKEPEIKACIGNMLYTDPTFLSGENDISLYDYDLTGKVSIERKEIEDSPVNSKYAIEIKSSIDEVLDGGYGGFAFRTPTEANKEFVSRIIARFPVGYYLNFTGNEVGDTEQREWLTSNAGTGEWEEYVFKLKCGSTGTFDVTNYFYLNGGEMPSESSPLIWHVAYATVIDTTVQSNNQYIIMVGNDNGSGIVGYGLSKNSDIQPNFTEIPTTNIIVKMSDELTEKGIYYIWLKDYAGNISKYSIIFN